MGVFRIKEQKLPRPDIQSGPLTALEDLMTNIGCWDPMGSK